MILVTILVWKFPRFLGVICFDRWVSKEGHKYYFQDWIKLSWHSRSRLTQSILAISVEQGLPFAQALSLENSEDSYLCFWLALLISVSYFFILYQWPSLLLCILAFDAISSNIEKVLSIIPSANVFVFGDFNVHHKGWLTYSSWTDRAGELKWPYSEHWPFCGD